MSVDAPAGLSAFPVTKFAMVTTGLIPLLAAISSYKYVFYTSYSPFLSEYHQYYKLLIFQLAAVNETDVILLILIWYQLRNLERVMGSFKYISVIALTYIYTTILISSLNLLVNWTIPWTIWNRYPTGTLPVVLALFHFYKEYTPQVYEFNVLLTQPLFSSEDKGNKQMELKLNDQFLLNSLCFLLCLNQGLVGIICGFVSWLCGVFMEKGLLPGVDTFRLPFINKLLFNRVNSRGSHVVRSLVQISEDPHHMGQDNGSRTPLLANDSNTILGGTNSSLGDEENTGDEPIRPLGVQFLDTFRR